MTNKHTEGPWDYTFQPTLNLASVTDSDHVTIAHVWGGNEVKERIQHVARKNAALIAAAPDLLEVLEELLDCPDLNLGNLENETIEAINQATAAIAKARGES